MDQRPPDPPAPSGNAQPNRRLSYRTRHRAAQDDLAHAEGQLPPAPLIPDNPLIPRGEPELVTTAPALAELVAHLRAAGTFAYDSEFIGEQSYVPRVCLIQVATAARVALIDPFAGMDLRAFWELLADPGVEKVVHAGLQDLEPVWRFLGRPAANVFDTQIAAGFVGRTYPMGLLRLVEEFVGVALGKSPKFSQWDRRPLTRVQLAYAANDVRFLPALRAKLGQHLDELGNAAWAVEESNALTDVTLYRFDAAQLLQRMRGTERLRRRELAVLQALLGWRDAAARQDDLPPRTFLKDGILLDMARNSVRTPEEVAGVWGLPRPVKAAHAQTIIDLTQQALALPQEALPAACRPELSPDEQAAVDVLWAAMLERAKERHVDAAVLGSRSELARVFRQVVHGRKEELPISVPARRESISDLKNESGLPQSTIDPRPSPPPETPAPAETPTAPESRMLRGWRRELLGTMIPDAAAALRQQHANPRRASQSSKSQIPNPKSQILPAADPPSEPPAP